MFVFDDSCSVSFYKAYFTVEGSEKLGIEAFPYVTYKDSNVWGLDTGHGHNFGMTKEEQLRDIEIQAELLIKDIEIALDLNKVPSITKLWNKIDKTISIY